MREKYSKFVELNHLSPHYSTSLFQGYLECLTRALGESRSREILSDLPVSWEYLSSPSNWISEEVADMFYDKVFAASDVPKDIAFQAGMYSMSSEALGSIALLFSKFLSPQDFFRESMKHARRLNKVDILKINESSRGSFKFSFKSRRSTPHFQAICQGWKGTLVGLLKLHNASNVKVDVKLEANHEAEFHVRWLAGAAWYHGESIGAITFTMAGLLFGLSRYFDTEKLDLMIFTLAAAGIWMKLNARYQAKKLVERQKLEEIIEEHEARYLELFASKSKLDRRFREANLLRGVISRITQAKSSEGLIKQTIEEIQSSLGYDRVMYFAFDSDRNCLSVGAQSGFNPEQWKILSKYAIDLGEVTDSGMHLGNIFKLRRNILVPVSSDYVGSLSSTGRQLVELSGSKSFLACTVATDHSAFGVLLVDYFRDDIVLTNDDLHIIENLSNQLAILLDNASILEKETKLRKSFQKFVPSEVINQMMSDERGRHIDQVRSGEITVLFSDIRGFTVRSDNFPAELLVSALNHYLSRMTDIVYRNGGIVDKFLGDGVMAIFNAFGTSEHHADQAVKVAVEMMQELEQINSEIAKMMAGRVPWVSFEIGIGLHSGTAIVGNIGSRQKIEFTAIGRVVNIAARLQDLTKLHPGIIISDQSYKMLKEKFDSTNLGMKQIRGIKEPMQIHKIEWDFAKERAHARTG